MDELPLVHLEAEIPDAPAQRWTLTVDGHVDRPQVIALPDLVQLGSCVVEWDFHCVWGWSRRGCRWAGVPGAAVAASAGVRSGWVVVGAWSGTYASSLTIDELAAGVFATHLDGEPLSPAHGGPLRFVPPPGKWAYKGVKWASRITATTDATAGFWESTVGNPRGDIPHELENLDHEH